MPRGARARLASARAESPTGADIDEVFETALRGLVTSFLLELTVYPAIFALGKGRGLAKEEDPTKKLLL